MDRIRITRNIRRIEVNDSGEYITLDFDDLDLPYRFYGMLRGFGEKRAHFAQRLAESAKNGGENPLALAEVEREMNIYFRDAVDKVFGAGTCRKVYGDILPSVEMHLEFFDALRPYFEEEAARRREKMSKYSAKRSGNSEHNA